MDLEYKKRTRLPIEERKKKSREYMKEWLNRGSNRQRANERSKKYRERKRNGRPSFRTLRGPERKASTRSYREIIVDFLVKRDGLLCWRCAEPVDGSTVSLDHVVPVALGGKNIMENLKLAHLTCNISQGFAVRRKLHGY